MSESLELWLRLGAFVGLFVVFAACERLVPRRVPVVTRARRWATNLAITMLGTGLVRLLALVSVPLVATAAARWASAEGVGLLNVIDFAPWLKLVVALLVLDLAIYVQHRLSHRIGFLWRIHRVHHADRDLDVTSAFRFHPIEIGLSMLYKVGIVLALGPSVAAVIIFEVLLSGCALFNHANWRLPAGVDRLLRLILVTPDVHRVHHSVIGDEQNSNYGFSVTWWDRLLGTFRAAPREGQLGMTVGLETAQTHAPSRLGWSLALPFARDVPSSEKRSSDS